MGKISAIVSGKGGVGKSTITVGLGYSLAQKNKRILLLDCDAGLRTIDRLTSVDSNLVYDVSDVVKGNCSIQKAIYPVRSQENLFVMPAPANSDDMLSVSQMKRLISILRNHFDVILLDAPAGIDKGFRVALSIATNALVVCTPDPVCIRSTLKVHSLLSENGVINQKLIINRFSDVLFNKINIYEDLDRVIDETSIPLIGVIPEDGSLAACFLRGQKAPENSIAQGALHRIAARIEGESIPIPLI